MLEPVSIPPSPAATHPNNMATTTKQQQDLDALRNAAVRDQQQTPRGVLNHSSSGEWSDKDGKDSMSSPGMPPHHELNRSESIGSARVEHAASSTLQTPRAWMGLAPMATVDEELDHAEHNHFFWSKVKIAFKEPFAEFWGTFVLVLFGKYHFAVSLNLSANQYRYWFHRADIAHCKRYICPRRRRIWFLGDHHLGLGYWFDVGYLHRR